METMIKKEKFESPSADVVLFDTVDVITESLPGITWPEQEF